MHIIRTITACIILIAPVAAHAAGIHILTDQSVGVADELVATVQIESRDSMAGSIEGVLTVPPELRVKAVRTDGSMVTHWISEPAARGNGISFAAMMPVGYRGDGPLFTLVLTAVREGTAQFALQDVAIFAADGAATPLKQSHMLPTVLIGPQRTVPRVASTTDTVPPEPFTVELVTYRDPDGTEHPPYLAFNAVDRQSGGVTYALQRSWWPTTLWFLSWRPITSPYSLQGLDYYAILHITATDAAGNVRYQRAIPWYPLRFVVENWLLVLLCILVASYFVYRYRNR